LHVADRVIDSIVAHFAFLARQPEAGQSLETTSSIFAISKPRLVISRILHAKRDQSGAWNKPEAS
jgi:plasmid stabilization system protein ParE